MTDLLTKILEINVYLQPVLFFLSIITNTINVRVLCSHDLRLSACTHYFLAYAIFNIIYTCLICPTEFLLHFHIDWSTSLVGCRIRAYVMLLAPFLARTMLTLASFDRYCSSSHSHRFHVISEIQSARLIIVITTIISIIYMSPLVAIYHREETPGACLQYSNLLINMYIFSQILLYYILAPILMILFGLLTISNVRQLAARIGPRVSIVRHRRTGRQLTRLLLLQIGIHLILTMPFGVIYSMNSFKPSTQPSNTSAVRHILVIWQQCDCFVSFFLYLLSGSTYRKHLARILKLGTHQNHRIDRSIIQQAETIQ
ncbi:unnamed protein product [Rotaria socialis]|uniref:G-protein coupled receptors family 1 profile domain-containing protein n=1 Tax=Rotaria socialis TaxID=392032 RepID=A0A817V5J3_9BILA|nr:unnamed protein product [Rotaria socialis]CAF3373686.1 unnamed protein product [Rotaria socialis]CAF3413595.1 unnamed protein product [Rotaria socialis]CAF4111728.1 unnamed protein product [Rotaria socialis]CAF4346149.1 unnamed protein product [Rotaria socialis]